jgi:hypothetical protein
VFLDLLEFETYPEAFQVTQQRMLNNVLHSSRIMALEKQSMFSKLSKSCCNILLKIAKQHEKEHQNGNTFDMVCIAELGDHIQSICQCCLHVDDV